MAAAIGKIQEEHRTLDKVLGVLSTALDALTDKGPKPSLDLLYSIIYYVRVFPDKLHHPKEEKILFPALRRHRPELAPTMDQLAKQHEEGRERLADLHSKLVAFDQNYPAGLDELLAVGREFVASQREHMSLEEREILPAAKACLTSRDLASIRQAFAINADPLFADNIEAGFRALFARITDGDKRPKSR